MPVSGCQLAANYQLRRRSKMLGRCVVHIFFRDNLSAGSPSSRFARRCRFLFLKKNAAWFLNIQIEEDIRHIYLQRPRGDFLYFAHTTARNIGSKVFHLATESSIQVMTLWNQRFCRRLSVVYYCGCCGFIHTLLTFQPPEVGKRHRVAVDFAINFC